MELNALHAALRGVSAYRKLMETPVMLAVDRLFQYLNKQSGSTALSTYTELFCALRQEGCEGLGDWLWNQLRYTESLYSRLIDRNASDRNKYLIDRTIR